jgi:hypothetical protein
MPDMPSLDVALPFCRTVSAKSVFCTKSSFHDPGLITPGRNQPLGFAQIF